MNGRNELLLTKKNSCNFQAKCIAKDFVLAEIVRYMTFKIFAITLIDVIILKFRIFFWYRKFFLYGQRYFGIPTLIFKSQFSAKIISMFDSHQNKNALVGISLKFLTIQNQPTTFRVLWIGDNFRFDVIKIRIFQNFSKLKEISIALLAASSIELSGWRCKTVQR